MAVIQRMKPSCNCLVHFFDVRYFPKVNFGTIGTYPVSRLGALEESHLALKKLKSRSVILKITHATLQNAMQVKSFRRRAIC